MTGIIDFATAKENKALKEPKKKTAELTMPTAEEIELLNALGEQIDKDDMVPIQIWNGECWHKMFEILEEHAKKDDLDTWEVFAVFISKVLGMKYIDNGDGSWTVGTEKGEMI